MNRLPRLALTFLVAASTLAATANDFSASTVLTDHFDESFDLDWKIIREDADAYSLDSHSGELALTTLPGSMYARNELAYQVRPQNIFLLEEPIGLNQNFQATLHVSLYEPEVQYQQIALLMYQSDEYYAKWEISLRKTGSASTRLGTSIERDNKVAHISSTAYSVDGPFWLRLTRVDGQYEMSISDDGDEFVVKKTCPANPDPNQPVPQIGFVAKNGNVETDRNIIVVESFELRLSE